MILTKFYKNFILYGDADYYCLLCNEIFHKVDDIEKHIRWEKHRKVLKNQTYVPKFKNDGICKVETYYYCQYCNQIFKNIATIQVHIATQDHILNKSIPEESKKIKVTYDYGTIKVHNIKINNHQWHSILNKKCYICDIGVDNISKHIETKDHIIKLIQTEIQIEGDEKYYRKVNHDTFQCFTCNNIFSANSFNTHWQNSDHVKPQPNSQKTNDHTEGPIKIYDREEYNKIIEKEFSIEKLANIKDDMFFKIDLINKEIVCKNCNNAVKNTKKDLTNHLYNRHKTFNTGDSNIISYISKEISKEVVFIFEKNHGKARHELAIYGRDNHIKLNCGGSKGYCTLCDRFLSAHINIFKQHIGGTIHTAFLEMNNEIKPRKHKKGPSRLETLSRYLNKMVWMPELKSVAINMSVCIDRDSFLLMKKIEHGPHFKKVKCFACDQTLVFEAEKKHRESKSHKSNVMAAKVILEKYNFLREVRPKLYHCGLCNMTLPFWETLEKHICDMNHQMKMREKHYVCALKDFKVQTGVLPSAIIIEHSINNDVLYANILSGLFDD